MFREILSPLPVPEEETAPESREIPVAFTTEREDGTLRFTIHDAQIQDPLSHVLQDRFPLERIHQRRTLGVLHFTVDDAATLTDEEIDQIKEEVAIAARRAKKISA